MFIIKCTANKGTNVLDSKLAIIRLNGKLVVVLFLNNLIKYKIKNAAANKFCLDSIINIRGINAVEIKKLSRSSKKIFKKL